MTVLNHPLQISKLQRLLLLSVKEIINLVKGLIIIDKNSLRFFNENLTCFCFWKNVFSLKSNRLIVNIIQDDYPTSHNTTQKQYRCMPRYENVMLGLYICDSTSKVNFNSVLRQMQCIICKIKTKVHNTKVHDCR
jgi:hypothetical protein